MPKEKLFLGGEWVESVTGETFAATSPSTGEKIAEIAKGGREDVLRAVRAAREACRNLSRMSPFDRAAMCHRIADSIEKRREELARTVTLDQGKPLHAEAFGEVSECIEYFRIAAEDAKRMETSVIPSASRQKRVLTIRQPKGVVGIISPWNWPLTMPSEFIAPALASGNAVVWAPSEATSLVSVRLSECLAEADLPPGAFNMITGPGPVVGDEVAGNEGVNAVAFVGSTQTGLQVARRAAGKSIILEMGGNGPIIVLRDADVEKAAAGILPGCFLCAGQSCTAAERILVHRDVYDPLVESLVDAVSGIVLGDPFDPETTMGPVNNEVVAERTDRHIAEALSKGAELLAGGRRADGFPTDLYYHPTVLSEVNPAMQISREETFGPVAPLTPVADDDEALRLANDSPYGLLASVFTRDLIQAVRFAEELESGWVNINEGSNYWESHLPFGGRSGKLSGLGRVGGRYAMRELTDLKTIVVDVG